MCWVFGSDVTHGVDVFCLMCYSGQEPKVKGNLEVPSPMGTSEKEPGSPSPADPKSHGKGPEATSVLGRREAASSSELAWCRNNYCMAEEAGRSTEQVAGVQTGTEEMLRASL